MILKILFGQGFLFNFFYVKRKWKTSKKNIKDFNLTSKHVNVL
jgi:hypothetical protein